LDDILINYGYEQYRNNIDEKIPHLSTISYSKRIKNTIMCQTNNHLRYHTHLTNFKGQLSWSIEITAETVGSVWVDLKFYSLQYTDLKDMESFEKKLLVMWEAANAV